MQALQKALVKRVDNRVTRLVLFFLLLNVADCYISLYIVKIGVEVNPFQRWMMELGSGHFLSGKIFAAAIIGVYLAASDAVAHRVLKYAVLFYCTLVCYLAGSLAYIFWMCAPAQIACNLPAGF